MTERVDARDVLDANATTSRSFRAKLLGHFRRSGPNSWDDYVFVRAGGDEEDISVYPGVRVQLERSGCELRLRSHGRVVRVSWIPEETEADALRDIPAAERRRFFTERCLSAQADAPGLGAAAVIVDKLDD